MSVFKRIGVLALLVATFAAGRAADVPGTSQALHSVDLRDASALERLQRTHPSHYAAIRAILAGLAEDPERLDGDWLQANFDARDVDLSRLILKTSDPPRQLLRFTLDDTRYTVHVVRSDLVARPEVLR